MHWTAAHRCDNWPHGREARVENGPVMAIDMWGFLPEQVTGKLVVINTEKMTNYN